MVDFIKETLDIGFHHKAHALLLNGPTECIQTLMLGAVALGIAACAREEAPTISGATAAEETECVQRASAAYGVGLEYISLGDIGEDRTGAYPFAIPGTAFVRRIEINCFCQNFRRAPAAPAWG